MHDPPRILAVDDTPENLEILRMRLEANGYEVATAADGEEGLAKARELTPDLILLDIMMPKLDGISVVRMLKPDDLAASDPGHSRHREGRHARCGRGAGCRGRRLSDKALRAQGAARAGALDAAPEGASRHCREPGPDAFRTRPRSFPTGTARSSKPWPSR